ncbi:hypothetical protein SELMODRAFT_405431 [Selaginella moellendorffii]|uniref:Uncharacterized protein n=1 Tax=Selaginella moellendorffii TaxID=88036 RepID=D8QYK0_SELML|nr:hypothetical protein SELMODRAFT_405431 [Selaginella moellendorffii]
MKWMAFHPILMIWTIVQVWIVTIMLSQRISKPTLYKYMQLVDPNWRGVLEEKNISVATWNLHDVCLFNVVITSEYLMFLQTYFNRWNERLGLCRLLVEKNIEDLLGPFLSNVKSATLSEAFDTV